MPSQERGPAYVVSLIAGLLILIGGVVRGSASGVLPTRTYGFRLVSNVLRSSNLDFGASFAQLSAVIGIVSGIVILVSAVMLTSRAEQYPAWGTIILVFSVIGFLGGGGFLVGSILGIAGGILAMTTRPVPRTI